MDASFIPLLKQEIKMLNFQCGFEKKLKNRDYLNFAINVKTNYCLGFDWFPVAVSERLLGSQAFSQLG